VCVCVRVVRGGGRVLVPRIEYALGNIVHSLLRSGMSVFCASTCMVLRVRM